MHGKFAGALALSLLSSTAMADAPAMVTDNAHGGWYAGALGGLNFNQTTDGNLLFFKDAYHYNSGYGAGLFAGYEFGPLRLQGELAYRRNGIKSLEILTATVGLKNSFVSTVAPMLSALYDVETGTPFTPYLGFGFGAARLKTRIDGESTSKWTPAYQGIAGVNYELASNWQAGVEYRYFETAAVNGLGTGSIGQNQGDFATRSQSLFFNVTYRFGEEASGLPPVLADLGGNGRWYAGTLGGLNVNDSSGGDFLGLVEAKTHYNKGYAAGGFAGYALGQFRLQADVIYRHNGIRSVDIGSPFDGSLSTSGASVSTVAPMFSALYDLETVSGFTPYVGVGIGAARLRYQSPDVSALGLLSGFEQVPVTNKWTPAYQAIAGLDYDVAPDWKMGVQYRYFATPGINKLGVLKGSGGPFGGIEISRNDLAIGSHSVFLAVTYSFGDSVPAPVPAVVAAPPPPAPPAPELARSYLVFFDWNSSAVTAEAAGIVGEVARAATQLAVTRVELTGHADRSGSSDYNQKLSEKRGAAVKNALVQLGIPAANITVVGKGEASPLVPTADGVREPQNRRVEIVLP